MIMLQASPTPEWRHYFSTAVQQVQIIACRPSEPVIRMLINKVHGEDWMKRGKVSLRHQECLEA